LQAQSEELGASRILPLISSKNSVYPLEKIEEEGGPESAIEFVFTIPVLAGRNFFTFHLKSQ
jgi:hypothetical protein